MNDQNLRLALKNRLLNYTIIRIQIVNGINYPCWYHFLQSTIPDRFPTFYHLTTQPITLALNV